MTTTMLILVVALVVSAVLVLENRRLTCDLERAMREAMRDGLTGLLSRTGFVMFADQQIRLVGRGQGYDATLVFIDLNNFKPVNDRYGHLVGDELLVRFAEFLQTRLRASDIVGRIGGDEFVVLLPRTNALAAAHIVEELSARLRKTSFEVGEYLLKVDAAIGYAQAEKGITVAELLARADKNMYEAKRAQKFAVHTMMRQIIST